MTSLSVHHRGSLVGSAAAGSGSGPISPGGSNSEATTSSSNTSMAARDCQELKTLTLEWKLANLKQIFDSSQGQAKSKCIRSSPFGDGKWELYFYANSSADYVSLYLSAEPTQEEKDAASRMAAKQASSSSSSPSSRTLLGSSASYGSLRSSSTALLAGGGGPSNQSNTAQSQPQQQQPWIREGSYRFVFEIRPVREAIAAGGSAKAQPLKMMEAADHVFSSEARNWGWQSFARRSDLYYNNPTSKAFDAFIISCTITYSATPPTPAPVVSHKRKLVPAELLDAFAGMFDDPLYSDVRFVIRTRSRRTGRRVERSLYAIRKVLTARSEYFATMFSSGFSEGKALDASQSSSRLGRGAPGHGQPDGDGNADGDSQMSSLESDDDFAMYESSLDSDGDGIRPREEQEQEQEQPDGNADNGQRDEAEQAEEGGNDEDGGDAAQEEGDSDEDDGDEAEHTAHTSLLVSGAEDDEAPSPSHGASSFGIPAEGAQLISSTPAPADRYPGLSGAVSPGPLGSSRNASLLTPGTRSPASASRPTTMRSSSTSGSNDDRRNLARGGPGTSATTNSTVKANPRGARASDLGSKASRDNSRKYIEVVVKDVTYSTYRAFIQFLYTDTIVFAPLSSAYSHAKDTAELAGLDFPFPSRQKYQQATGQAVLPAGASPDLICSAKAIYRLADKLEIPELKSRAFEHIVQSLTVETLPYEAFSAFSDQFREIRQVQLDLLLAHWNEVKNGQALKNIFRLVRHDPDRFPGYDELMPAILSCLEFKAPPPGTSPSSGGTGAEGYHHQQQHLHKAA